LFRAAGAGTVLQEPAAASAPQDRADQNLRQRLDRHERRDSERRDDRGKLRCRGGVGGHKNRRAKYRCRGQSCGCCEKVRVKRKRIVVMGFMGSIPIAGVIWQHIHYIVGLQRLGHDVYYIEDSARLPYNPETFDTGEQFDYAAKILTRLSREFDFKNLWAFCASLAQGTLTAGLLLM